MFYSLANLNIRAQDDVKELAYTAWVLCACTESCASDNVTNQVLSYLLCTWMDKFTKMYLKMPILKSILVSSRLCL